ncbi:hypothetical protein H8D85_01765 [bacterium]|nr:hypothetical protein [bacterium]
MPSTNDPFGVSNTHSHIKSGDLLIFSLTTSVAVDSVSLDFNGTSYNMTNLSSNGMD